LDEFLLNGNHEDGRTDGDVNGVVFKSSRLTEVPLAIFTTFINLKFLNIRDTQLKTIVKSTFQSCDQLN